MWHAKMIIWWYIHVFNMSIINVLGSVTYNNPWTNYRTVDKNKGLMYALEFRIRLYKCIIYDMKLRWRETFNRLAHDILCVYTATDHFRLKVCFCAYIHKYIYKWPNDVHIIRCIHNIRVSRTNSRLVFALPGEEWH
jgi:hypothetical protein